MTDAANLPAGAVHIAGDTYYVPGLTNSGFIDGLCIDTGPEPEPYDGVAIDRLAITHGHADHFAAGSVLRDRGATVVAARDDAALVENPDINIRGMFSWAKPGDILVTKLFLGVPCKVDALVEDWRDRRATPYSLPGHTLGHTAFLTRDGVLFTGDALYEEALWKRHPLPYAIDPDMVARSLEHIRDIEFDWLVPGHGELVDRAQAMRDIDFHLAQIESIQELLLAELRDAPHHRGGHRARLAQSGGSPTTPRLLARGHHGEGVSRRPAGARAAGVLGRRSRGRVEDRRDAREPSLADPARARMGRTRAGPRRLHRPADGDGGCRRVAIARAGRGGAGGVRGGDADHVGRRRTRCVVRPSPQWRGADSRPRRRRLPRKPQATGRDARGPRLRGALARSARARQELGADQPTWLGRARATCGRRPTTSSRSQPSGRIGALGYSMGGEVGHGAAIRPGSRTRIACRPRRSRTRPSRRTARPSP